MNKDNKLEEIRERLELSAPGPWRGETRVYGSTFIYDENDEPIYFIDAEGALEMGENDLNFITNSKEDISYLLEKISKLEGVLEQAKEHIDNRNVDECLNLVYNYKGE